MTISGIWIISFSNYRLLGNVPIMSLLLSASSRINLGIYVFRSDFARGRILVFAFWRSPSRNIDVAPVIKYVYRRNIYRPRQIATVVDL